MDPMFWPRPELLNVNKPSFIPLLLYQVDEELRKQLAVGNYLSSIGEVIAQPDRIFTSNEAVWHDVLSERLRSGITITLEDFFLFEWFPRSPGLYHTRGADTHRASALDNMIELPSSSEPEGVGEASRLDNQVFAPEAVRAIFNLTGKMLMLEGGIGSIRLKDVNIVDIGHVWFMAASSTNTAHEGFPIALPDKYYQRHIDQIVTMGVAPCTITGKLRFVPDTLNAGYGRGVPQLYLLVDDVKRSTRKISDEEKPQVSVAVMFSTESYEQQYEYEANKNFFSEYEKPDTFEYGGQEHEFSGSRLGLWDPDRKFRLGDFTGQEKYKHGGGKKIFFSYVTFFPSQPGSLESRVDWLENKYVKDMYKGKVITDFDEQNRRFETAEFSLKKIMTHQVSSDNIEMWVSQQISVYGNSTFSFEGQDIDVNVHAERIDQMTHQEINIGNNNKITAPITIAKSIQNSFNALNDSRVHEEVRELLEELLKAIAEVNKTVPSERLSDAESLARDAETLTKEASSSKPRTQWYEISLKGLKQAAINIGELAGPVLKIVEKLSPLLLATG